MTRDDTIAVEQYQGFSFRVDRRGVAVVTFERPERLNAMSFATRRDLVEVLSSIQLDDRVRVVIITGAGKGFCAGVYLGEAEEQAVLARGRTVETQKTPVNLNGRLRAYAQELVRTVRRLDKPTIAAVNGYAIQIGLSLALACDFVIAAESAKLGSATLRMGYQPDEGGHWLLVEHLGVKGAIDFAVRKRIVGANDALRLALATEVVPDEDLLDRADKLAAELAEGPQVATRLLKRAIYNAAHLTFDQAADDIATRTAISDFHLDATEGWPAWARREAPVFNQWLANQQQSSGSHRRSGIVPTREEQ